MSKTQRHPPRLAAFFLRVTLPDDPVRDSILGDFWEEHGRLAAQGSSIKARLWYWRQALGLGGRSIAVRFRTPDSDQVNANGSSTAVKNTGGRGDRGFLDNRVHDLRFAARQLARRPGFTALVVVTLALGIGPNVAIFSVMRALLFEPFPWPEPSEVVHVYTTDVGSRRTNPSSVPDHMDLRERNTSFEEFGAYTTLMYNIGGEEAERVQGIAATAGALRAFGVEPALGRLYTDEEEMADAPVAVISDGLWKRKYGADPEVVGEQIRLNSLDYTLLGIMPEGFDFYSPWYRGRPYEIWAPLVFDEEDRQGRRSYSYLQIGRVRDGVSWGAAQAEVDSIAFALADEYPQENARTRFWVVPAVAQIVTEPAGTLIVLLGTVGLVLLIACANVASMLLARGAGRQSEVAIRVSLGAARRRIIVQLLTESLLLSVLGGLAGVTLAFWSLGSLKSLIPPDIPRAAAISIDTTVLVFTLGLTLLTGLIFGLAPAITAVRTDIVGALKEGGGGLAGVRARNRWLRRFAVVQIALALVLTNGAVILFQSYRNLLSTPHAFDTERSLTGEIWLWGPAYTDNGAKVRFWEDLAMQLEAVPGVEHAAVTSKLPLQGGTSVSVLLNDETFDPNVRRTTAERSVVSSGYFDAIGITVLQGRTVTEADNDPAGYGVVVNRALVEHAWPDENPIGKLIRSNDNPPPWTARVVGVVEDVRQWSERQPWPEVYFPYGARPAVRGRLVVRTAGAPLDSLPAIRAELAGIDADLPLADVRTMSTVFSETTRHRRFLTMLVDLFTLTAVILAIVGIYGNMSYHVAQRTHEIGVRVALGADNRALLSMVLKHALRLAAMGVAIGLVLTLTASVLAGHWAYGISFLNPLFLLGGTLFVLTVAMLAAGLPAIRAAKVDPIQALRSE